MGSDAGRVIGLDLTFEELNPNHKCRLAIMVMPLRFYWLAEIGLVKRDESVYLMPLIARDAMLSIGRRTGGPFATPVRSGAGFHISMHDSGALNVDTGLRRFPVRPRTNRPPLVGALFTIVVNSVATLRETTTDEMNAPRGGKHVVPLAGAWRPGAVAVTVFRSTAGARWSAPVLGDMVQINTHLPVRNKSLDYHLVVWQKDQLVARGGEIEIYFPRA